MRPVPVLLTMLPLLACDPTSSAGDTESPVATGAGAHVELRTGYQRALADLDRAIASLETRAESLPGSWIALEQVSGAYAARAQLTGDPEDWLAAEEALSRAFDRAPEGAGPFASRASLHYSLHRMAEARADLDAARARLLLADVDRAALSGRAGDVAFHSGRYDEAAAEYEAAEALSPSSATAFRLAQYHHRTLQPDAARTWLEAARARIVGDAPQLEAWMALQQGLVHLDAGRYEDALAVYDRAAARFDGWWLVDEHRAEVLALLGRVDEAIALYRSVVRRTGHPELLDALAIVLHRQGALAEAAELDADARREWERRLALLPEAYYGHALAHYLATGDPDRALELALANRALRPDAEADMWVAQAALAAGDPELAQRSIEGALATPWRTAELHVTATLVFEALGDEERARTQRELAAALHEHPDDLTPPGL